MLANKIIPSVVSALKLAAIVFVIAAILAFLGAPVFLGMVILTASAIVTVYAYTAIAFVIGFLWKLFFGKVTPTNVNSNG